MNNSITVRASIFIESKPEQVWDFTQDFEKRSSWDTSILQARIIQLKPSRIVEIKTKGNLIAKLVYKQDHRPIKTSLVMTEIQSNMIKAGGGSWRYQLKNNGTLWTLTNTLVLKEGLFYSLLVPMVKFQLRSNTRKSMKLAKRLIEMND